LRPQVTDLTLDEKIGQLLLVANWPTIQRAIDGVEKLGCGGVWPGAGPKDDSGRFREMIKDLQSRAKIPLFICTDFELGAGQFMTDGTCVEFPALMAYGAIADEDDAERLAHLTGAICAQEAEYLGVNITPSPVFDVNTVPTNPICNTRSVGSDYRKVSRIATAYALGMQTGRLLGMAKHFAGEGMHEADPHFALEEMNVTEEEMEAIHLKPFYKAAEAGVASMMTNHAIYRCYDPDYPVTLSRKIITGILREKIGFDGLVVTDAMAMAGIVSRYGPEDAVILAINAGNDLILDPTGLENVHEWVHKALEDGRMSIETIDTAVDRILRYKDKLRLFDEPHPTDNKPAMPLADRQAVAREVADKSVTIIRDDENMLPLLVDPTLKVLLLEPSHPYHEPEWGLKYNLFSICDALKQDYPNSDIRYFSSKAGAPENDEILELAAKADMVFISTSFKSQAGQVGLLNSVQVDLLRGVAEKCSKCVYVASNPYVASELPFAGTIVANYGPYRISVEAVRDAMLGKIEFKGKLPVELPQSIDPSGVEVICHD